MPKFSKIGPVKNRICKLLEIFEKTLVWSEGTKASLPYEVSYFLVEKLPMEFLMHKSWWNLAYLLILMYSFLWWGVQLIINCGLILAVEVERLEQNQGLDKKKRVLQ